MNRKPAHQPPAPNCKDRSRYFGWKGIFALPRSVLTCRTVDRLTDRWRLGGPLAACAVSPRNTSKNGNNPVKM